LDGKLIWRLAYRYLRGKRLGNAVPILSRISMVAIAVCSAAMVLIFSIFNGLEDLVKNEYVGFYPDVKVTVAKGKFFLADDAKMNAVRQIAGVRSVTGIIEDNVLAISADQQIAVRLKGITNDYFSVNDIRDSISGADTVSACYHTAIAGRHIANQLSADMNNVFSNIELYYINSKVTNFTENPSEAYQSLKLHPVGIFSVSDEFDSKYVLAPLSLVQELFHEPGKYSSVEVSTEEGSETKVKRQLQQLFGSNYIVETRYEQNRTMYRVMSTEKWAIYAILLLVLLIASFNMVGALSMLVLEKQKDIAILRAMGAQPGTIRSIFLLEGMLWSLVGGLFGIFLGVLICVIQQQFKIVKFDGSFMVDAYPVQLQLPDLLLVIITIMAVGLLTSWYPALRATKAADPALKSA
jgi:lipoprotein-releasing system permease protein